MSLSAAMNQMGGVVATLLAGLLAGIGWQWAFLVYLLGVFAIVMVVRYLPDEHLGSANKRGIPFQPRQASQIPSFRQRHASADDDLLYLSHQLCHYGS